MPHPKTKALACAALFSVGLSHPLIAQDRNALFERTQEAQRSLQATSPFGKGGGDAARSSTRIINGDFVGAQTDAANWGFTVSLQDNSAKPRGHFCGGVLISPVLGSVPGPADSSVNVVKGWDNEDNKPPLVLTAAHCVTQSDGDTGAWKEIDTKGLDVLSGNVNLNAANKVVQTVEKIIVHPEYDDVLMAHDLAILVLSEAPDTLPEGAKPRSIGLPNLADISSYKQTTAAHTVLGWGTTQNGALSQYLLQVRVPYSDQAQCRETYANIGWDVHASSFCAGFVSGGFDSCQGDSGSVLMHRPTTGANSNQLADPVLTGIVSWGRGCGWPGYSGVYADVMGNLPWIEKTAITALTD